MLATNVLHRMRSSSRLRDGAWALADQAVISLANFMMMLVLVRALGAYGFGVVSICLGVLILAISVQNGMICQPLNIIGPTLHGEAYKNFVRTSAVGQVAFTLLSVVLLAATSIVTATQGWSFAVIVLALVPVMVGYQGHAFVRRVMYMEDRLKTVFCYDLFNYGGQVVMIVSFWWTGNLGSALTALFLLSAPSLAATVLGFLVIRQSMSGIFNSEELKRIWRFGGWLGAASLVSALAYQIHVYIAAVILGPAALGVLRAAEIFFRPVGIYVTFLSTVLPIRFSKAMASGGTVGLESEVRGAIRMIAVPVLLLCAGAIVAGSTMATFLFGPDFDIPAAMLPMWSLFYFLNALERPFGVGLKVQQESQAIFRQTVLLLLTGTALAWIFAQYIGVYGVILGAICNVIVGLVTLWTLYSRSIERRLGEESATGE